MRRFDNCKRDGIATHFCALLCALLFCNLLYSLADPYSILAGNPGLTQDQAATKQATSRPQQPAHTQQPGAASAKDYFEFNFPPRIVLAMILYPETIKRNGKTINIEKKIFTRGRFFLPKSRPLKVYLKYDSIANMQYIEKLKVCQVVWLGAENLDFDDKCMTYITDFRFLQQLDLYGTLITDKALALIPPLSSIYILRLSHTAVTGETFRYLARLKNLGSLYASNIALKKGTVSQLKSCSTKLLFLDLGHTALSKEDAAQIPFFTNLTDLDISLNNQIDNSIIKNISQLKKLKSLHIEDTGITEQSLPILLKLPQLKTVYVRNSKFWRSGKPPGKAGRIKFVDIGTTEGSTLELLAPLH